MEMRNAPFVPGSRRFFAGRFLTGDGRMTWVNTLFWTDDGLDYQQLRLHPPHRDVGRVSVLQRSNGDLYVTGYHSINVWQDSQVWEWVVRPTKGK